MMVNGRKQSKNYFSCPVITRIGLTIETVVRYSPTLNLEACTQAFRLMERS